MKNIFTTPINDYRLIRGELIRIDKINEDEPVHRDELINALNNYNPYKRAYNRGVAHGLLYAAVLLILAFLLWLTKI